MKSTKNTYGFYPTKGGPLDVSLFLIENTIGLANCIGVSEENAEVTVEPMDTECPFLIGSTKLPPASNTPRATKEMHIRYNQGMIARGLERAAQTVVPMRIPYLWNILGSTLRFFAVRYLPIPAEDLLPQSVLERIHMPEVGTAVNVNSLERLLDVPDAKIMTDNAAISVYLLRLLFERGLRGEEVHMNVIGRIIFQSRRSNHKETLPKI